MQQYKNVIIWSVSQLLYATMFLLVFVYDSVGAENFVTFWIWMVSLLSLLSLIPVIRKEIKTAHKALKSIDLRLQYLASFCILFAMGWLGWYATCIIFVIAMINVILINEGIRK